jgi:hypothetical protein
LVAHNSQLSYNRYLPPSHSLTHKQRLNLKKQKKGDGHNTPSLYVLNAAALTKPFFLQHLTADLIGNQSDVAVITETHFKAKHTDATVGIDGYTMYRRDRIGRCGGGVAVYVRSELQSAEWKCTADDRAYEVLWVRIGAAFMAAIYHPPKPQYRTELLVQYIDLCVETINDCYLGAGVADGLRKCSGHDEHHVTLDTYVTLYISKSRPALAGVVDRAPPPMSRSTHYHCW